VAEALGGQRVTVGETLGVNPLDIRAVPASVQRTMGADANPFAEKLSDALSFLTNFFAQRGVQLGERRVTLELALIERRTDGQALLRLSGRTVPRVPRSVTSSTYSQR
jgi:hypothetical protein